MNDPILQHALDSMTDADHAHIDSVFAQVPTDIRTRPAKKYCFFTASHDWRPRLLISGPGGRISSYELTGDTYARFVALANSGAYLIEIDMDESVAWSLRRNA